MDYKINILGEFGNTEIEKLFLESEVKKSVKLIRYMILFSSTGFLLISIPEFIFRSDINIQIRFFSLAARSVIFMLGITLFYVMKRTVSTKVIRNLIFAFASTIYLVYFYIALYFVPLQIMSPTFCLIILTTCLFLMPNRWILNLSFSSVYSLLFILAMPYICASTSSGYRVVAISYLLWDVIIIGILFYNINVYKRNYFAKTLQLEELAKTDQLTKIHNRKSCDDILEDKCAGSSMFSIIMFDIDDFKLINDTYGHVTGDEVIVNITERAKGMVRRDDILARWGGEEFVVIMRDAALNEATELAKRLKDQLTVITHDGIRQTITCSFGVTAFEAGDNVKSIMRRADQLLYLAKEYGKNRVVAG